MSAPGGSHGSGARNTLALLGLRCSGKSTIGRLLADELERPFVDLDQELLRSARHSGWRVDSVGELLLAAGQARFRELEAWALRRALEPSPRTVLATGGGVVERSDNRAWLARCALSVHLSVPSAVLLRRAQADPTSRPSLLGLEPAQELALLRARRGPLYQGLAQVVIECGEDAPESIVASIVERIRGELPTGH